MALYLVTGGAGFIGSNVVAALEQRGDDVIVVDRLGMDDKWRNLAKRRLEDLVAPDGLEAVLAANADRLAGIVHMGAISATTERDADLIVATNFNLSCRLWRWCARAEVPFVYASSAATYGDGSNGFSDADDEAHLARLRPLNPYGWSKHLFDRWTCKARDRGEPTPPRWAGLKFFNVYGPNEGHKGPQRSVVAQLFDQIRDTGEARLFQSHHPDYGDGGQLRDFVWVGDAVAATLWMLGGQYPGGLYNVGSGTARSFNDLAAGVFEAMSTPQRIVYAPTPVALRQQYQYYTCADPAKLATAGFRQEAVTLEDGVKRYVADYLMKPDRFV